MMSNIFLLAVLVFLTSVVEAHTWLENIYLIGSNGSFVGTPGYPRGYGPRNVGSPDIANVYLLPPNGGPGGNAILPTDLMCKASQTIGTYTDGFPPISAAPSDQIALRHMENGHVTKITGVKPSGNGTVFVYGTTQPANTDTYLGIHRVWNAEGTGGDKRGKLLATRPLDDGRCFQVNGLPISNARVAQYKWVGTADNICQTDVQIPADAPTSGTYTMYWVWEWPTLDPVTGKVTVNESYTSCLDITMTAKSTVGKVDFSSSQQLTGPNVGLVAIPEQLTNQFLIDPSAQPALTAGPPFTMSALPAAATATSAPVASANPITTSATTTTLHTSSTTTHLTTAKPATTFAASNGFVTVTVTESVHEVATVTVTQDAEIPVATSARPQTPSSLIVTVTPVAATTAPPKATSSSVYTMPTGAPKVSPFLNRAARMIRVKGREVQL
jgi:hypothetical protein